MSLRARIGMIVLVAAVAMAAAIMALVLLQRDTPAERTARAAEQAAQIATTLATSLPAHITSAQDLATLPVAQAAAARIFISGVLAQVSDGSAGLCDQQGTLFFVATNGGQRNLPPLPPHFGTPGQRLPLDHHGRPHPDGDGARRPSLLPLDQDAVAAACRDASAPIKFQAPGDWLLIDTRAIAPDVRAFALVRINKATSARSGYWPWTVGFLIAVTALLLLITYDTVRQIRRSTFALTHSLQLLQSDLQAPVAQPAVAEFATIAAGVREFSQKLVVAQQRETELVRALGHEQHLIGLGRVVAGVAHEVRNPLTGLKLTLQGMARRDPDPRTQRDTALCLSEVDRLDDVVRSLLLVSRRGPLVTVATSMRTLIEARIARLNSLHPIEVTGDATTAANADELARVVDNLLRNALEASPADSAVKIIIAAGPQLGAARIEFIDHGSGIPRESLSRLFEPFFTLKPEGTGLGLVVSNAIVASHGGTLRYSRSAATTVFTIELPPTAAPP